MSGADTRSSPSAEVADAVSGMVALLAGEARDLRSVRLDLRRIAEFDRNVYEIARTVSPGETITYGEIAAAIGSREEAREVGQALARNPCPIVVPCHRVVAAGGKVGGFSASGGVSTKLRMLAIEARHAADTLPLFA